MPHRDGGSKAVADKLAWRGDVNAGIRGGTTPLYIAAQCGHLEVAKYLVTAGAEVNAANENGFTPLHIAAYFGHPEVAKYLVADGADVNAADKHGAPPLYVAAENGYLEVAKYLVSAGADVNAAEKERLHAAAFCCTCGTNKGILRCRSIS